MIHLIGASGNIGTYFQHYFKKNNFKHYTLYDVNSDLDYKELNLLSFDNSSTDLIHINDVVIILSAISSPDFCEKNPTSAYDINVKGTSKFIDCCLKKNANIIFFSSDVVYGNTSSVNNEKSICKPQGVYANMKYFIEKKYKESERFKAVRLSYVLSRNDSFTKYLDNCREKKIIPKVFNGLFRNVIRVEDVIESVFNLALNFEYHKEKVFNLCGENSLSRADLAEYYSNYVSQIDYEIIDVPKSILETRPNIILTESLHLSKLLKRKPKKIVKEKIL